ncbi:MAG TPA: DUF805 domain-containing protein [Ramlibacter sp.]|nr:DUF805 domain-containing protein [Ramlibacter sp.]
MNFSQAVAACLRKYVDFSGRAGRPEFWWFFLFQIIVMIVTGMMSDILNGIAALGLLLPGLAVGARRLHDIGKSAWFLLLGLIPILGFLVLLYWFVQPSAGANAYGNPEVTPDSPTVMPGPGQQ